MGLVGIFKDLGKSRKSMGIIGFPYELPRLPSDIMIWQCKAKGKAWIPSWKGSTKLNGAFASHLRWIPLAWAKLSAETSVPLHFWA